MTWTLHNLSKRIARIKQSANGPGITCSVYIHPMRQRGTDSEVLAPLMLVFTDTDIELVVQQLYPPGLAHARTT